MLLEIFSFGNLRETTDVYGLAIRNSDRNIHPPRHLSTVTAFSIVLFSLLYNRIFYCCFLCCNSDCIRSDCLHCACLFYCAFSCCACPIAV